MIKIMWLVPEFLLLYRFRGSELVKINLLAPHPKGSKLIFTSPFRVGAKSENQISITGGRRIYIYLK